MTDDPVLYALAELDEALARTVERSARIRTRIALIRDEREQGRSYHEIVPAEPRPVVVQMLTECAQDLDSAGARVRRAEASALHEEGMTMEQIAQCFGVTRQRVSVLLSRRRG
jgi:DNA-directed RNA polymerase sigma subunit (sigma70/sigma32)